MRDNLDHLQTETPKMKYEDWYLELCQLFAKAEKIDLIAVARHIRADEAMKWWEDGFTPYATFRENYQQ